MGSDLSKDAKERITSHKKNKENTDLNLKECQLKQVPRQILKFKNLKKVDLSTNQISIIPLDKLGK